MSSRVLKSEKYDYPYKDDKIVHNWVTAGGRNSDEDVTSYLMGISTKKLVDEICDNWRFKFPMTKEMMTKLVEEYRKTRKK